MLLTGFTWAAHGLDRGRGNPGVKSREPGFTGRIRPGQAEPSGVSPTGIVRGYDGMMIERAPNPFEPRREILRVPEPRQF